MDGRTASIDDVLERLVNDPVFQVRLTADPQAALEDYDLSADELAVLAGAMVEGASGQHQVETRQSKAGMAGLFTALAEGGGGSGSGMARDGVPSGAGRGDDVGFNPQPDPPARGTPIGDGSDGGIIIICTPGDDVGLGGPDTVDGSDPSSETRIIIIGGAESSEPD